MKEWVFHVRHNSKPNTVREVLLILDGHDGIDIDELLAIGQQYGYIVGTTARSAQSVKENPLQTARDLGLVESDQNKLTDLGRRVVQLIHLKPNIVNEFLHFLHYSIWEPAHPERLCFSWSYKTVCDQLWELQSTSIDRNQIAVQLADIARESFGITGVSLSKDSVQGIMNWLVDLDPPVLKKAKANGKETSIFVRRKFCPPESLILSVDYLYQQLKIPYQSNLLMDSVKRQLICKTCMLDPDEFETTLEWACGQFNFLAQGTSGGWGSYILLKRQPSLDDFMG